MSLSTREIQLESFKILKVVDEISKKLNLKYVLAWGTLIGAVRHKGFIPWDDDLDILMPREDYEKLQEYFIEHKTELEPYCFFSKKTYSNYPYMIGRVSNTEYKLVSEIDIDYGIGTFIDIYPMDGAGNKKKNFLFYKSCLYTTMLGIKSRKKFVKTFNGFKSFIKYIVYLYSKIFTSKVLIKRLEKCGKKYSYENSKYIACLTWMDGGIPIVFDKNIFNNIIYTDFEGFKFPIPENYDEILRGYYGDYMKLPPEEQRIGHHYYEIIKK